MLMHLIQSNDLIFSFLYIIFGYVMHVLIVSPFFEINPSISRPSFINEVLTESGISTTVLTSNFSHPLKMYRKLEKAVQLKTISYGVNTSPFRFLSHTVLSFRFSFWILKNRSRFDKVYITIPFGLTALITSFFLKDKLIVDIVDLWPDSLPFSKKYNIFGFPIFFCWRSLNRFAVKRAHKVISLSSKFLHDAGASVNGIQIYLGAKKSTSTYLSKIDNQSTLRILYIGNVGRLYDFHTLIDSLKSFEFKCLFEIIGVGDQLDELSNTLVEYNIPHIVHGAIYDNIEISKVVARSDIAFNGFVDTTASLSYKSVLYFSHGLPIINSMKGDLWEIVGEYKVGFNYECGDKNSLLCALKNYWDVKQDNNASMEIRARVASLFHSHFDYDKVSKQVLRVFL